MSTDPTARAWIEVDGAALRRNLERVRRAAGAGAALIPMVKADAYGLGVEGAIRVLEPANPYGFGVATVEEGLQLRALGIDRPVLVFSPTTAEEVPPGVSAGLTFTLSDLSGLETIVRAAAEAEREVDVHVEIDTGMGRAGFPAANAAEWGATVAARLGERVRWRGAYTHFHSADVGEEGSVFEQAAAFDRAVAALPERVRPGLLLHLCNSAAALRFPALAGHAVRPGIVLYGGRPLPGGDGGEPVAAVRARVVFAREVAPGTTVGYGATHRAAGVERWATVAIGYGDGLPRALGNRGVVLVRGRRAPILGRISMDMTVVDISGLPDVERGEVVTFLGREASGQGETLSLEEVAEAAGTNSWEILTGFTSRVPRVWRKDMDA